MQEMRWLEHMPNGTLESGIELANEVYWALTIHEHEQRWYIWSGHALIFCADTRGEVDAFLYGLALAYGVLPGSVFEHMKDELKQWVE